MRLFPDESETIAGVAAALRRRELTCLDLVERCLNCIDGWEPKVHAWVSVDREGAKACAKQLDAELRGGHWRGPLHGIPLGIKDIVDIDGFPTGAGSKRMARTIATKDATVVRKLRDAGAILLGKTVTTQFASFDPPPTRNPWNPTCTPGGSSSGSAAAVATRMCLGAIGSQTGGSITRPATYCGAAGCKPSYGRVSLAGIVPLAPSMDHPGPIARSVRDLAILLDAISGPDPHDPHSLKAESPPIGLVDAKPAAIAPPRLARLRGFFETRADSDAQGAFDSAIARLRSAGATVVEAELPASFADIHRQHRVVMSYEAAAWHKRWFREDRGDYLPRIAELIEEGLAHSDSIYQAARQHQSRACDEVAAIFGSAPVAVCPAATGPAPDAATTGDPAFNSPWSYTRLPVVSFPVSLSAGGLPLGIQLIGRLHDERKLFETALWCEEVLRHAAT